MVDSGIKHVALRAIPRKGSCNTARPDGYANAAELVSLRKSPIPRFPSRDTLKCTLTRRFGSGPRQFEAKGRRGRRSGSHPVFLRQRVNSIVFAMLPSRLVSKYRSSPEFTRHQFRARGRISRNAARGSMAMAQQFEGLDDDPEAIIDRCIHRDRTVRRFTRKWRQRISFLYAQPRRTDVCDLLASWRSAGRRKRNQCARRLNAK